MSPNQINSTRDFVEQVKLITLVPGECLSSYDVSALFTSVPVDPALNIITDLLENDHTLKERTILAVSDIILLLDFVSRTPTFLSETSSMNRLKAQLWVSHQSHCRQPLHRVLRTKSSKHCSTPPRFWCRFVDDTFVIHKKQQTRLPSTHQQC